MYTRFVYYQVFITPFWLHNFIAQKVTTDGDSFRLATVLSNAIMLKNVLSSRVANIGYNSYNAAL